MEFEILKNAGDDVEVLNTPQMIYDENGDCQLHYDGSVEVCGVPLLSLPSMNYEQLRQNKKAQENADVQVLGIPTW